MRRFTDKVAVITGAGSGIGRALALDLAGRGARLAISDIGQERIDETVALCEKRGAEVRGYRLDVADRAAVLAHADEVVADFGRADLVINNAGVALAAPILEMKWDDLEWVMNIDFWGVVHGTKAFLPHLIASGDGHVVNISSVFGLVGVPTQSAYNAAKFAVRGFTEALRQEMAIRPLPGRGELRAPGRGAHQHRPRRAHQLRVRVLVVREKFDQTMPTSPAKAAQIILRGVQANRPRILVGPDAYALDATARMLGPFYQRVTAGGARVAKLFGALKMRAVNGCRRAGGAPRRRRGSRARRAIRWEVVGELAVEGRDVHRFFGQGRALGRSSRGRRRGLIWSWAPSGASVGRVSIVSSPVVPWISIRAREGSPHRREWTLRPLRRPLRCR